MIPTISFYFIACFGIAHVVITMLVGAARAPNQVHFYDDGDPNLRRHVRAHANFCENVPIALITMAAAEVSGTAALWLISGGVVFTLGRLIHYLYIRQTGWGPLRPISMVMTLTPVACFGLLTLYNLMF